MVSELEKQDQDRTSHIDAILSCYDDEIGRRETSSTGTTNPAGFLLFIWWNGARIGAKECQSCRT